ncbi:lysine-N-methylase [Enterobacteriaceae bacterium RIT711]|nr:lysine-N-methylase [Enterobacteriaceae bacterium RIT711]
MKEIVVTEPSFVTSFSCTGGACRDHCCRNWTINFDKRAVKKYTSSKDIEIRNIAVTSIQLTKKNALNNWGRVKFSEQTGNCPYLDEERLCMIQKKMGHEALSVTCSTYPRSQRTYRNEVQHSLSLSCPEVASIVFRDPNAMKLQQRVLLQEKLNTASAINQQDKLINLYCLSFIEQSENQVEVGLYAVIKFMLYIEKLAGIDDHTLIEVDAVYSQLLTQMHNDTLKNELAALSVGSKVKAPLVLLMQNFFYTSENTRGSGVMQYYIDVLFKTLELDEASVFEEKLAEVERVGGEIVLRDLQSNGYSFNNFIRYKFWQNDFPNQNGRSTLQNLYLIIAEYYYIQLLTKACAKAKGKIECDDVINIIYSFHSISQHSSIAAETFYKRIDTVRLGDDLSMIHLLA